MPGTRVDFYLLKDPGQAARLDYACRLVHKVYGLQLTVHVHTASAADAALFDEKLWTFAPGSFVPHERAGQGDGAPVLIAAPGEALPAGGQLLVNLSDAMPAQGDYPRIAELVDADPGRRDGGRERYRQYRELGHALETHEVGAGA